MRDLSDESKLSVRSIDEVFAVLDLLKSRAAGDRTIRYRDKRRPGIAAIVNALILSLESRSEDEQRQVIRDGMNRLNLLLAETDEERAAATTRATEAARVAPPQAPPPTATPIYPRGAYKGFPSAAGPEPKPAARSGRRKKGG